MKKNIKYILSFVGISVVGLTVLAGCTSAPEENKNNFTAAVEKTINQKEKEVHNTFEIKTLSQENGGELNSIFEGSTFEYNVKNFEDGDVEIYLEFKNKISKKDVFKDLNVVLPYKFYASKEQNLVYLDGGLLKSSLEDIFIKQHKKISYKDFGYTSDEYKELMTNYFGDDDIYQNDDTFYIVLDTYENFFDNNDLEVNETELIKDLISQIPPGKFAKHNFNLGGSELSFAISDSLMKPEFSNTLNLKTPDDFGEYLLESFEELKAYLLSTESTNNQNEIDFSYSISKDLLKKIKFTLNIDSPMNHLVLKAESKFSYNPKQSKIDENAVVYYRSETLLEDNEKARIINVLLSSPYMLLYPDSTSFLETLNLNEIQNSEEALPVEEVKQVETLENVAEAP